MVNVKIPGRQHVCIMSPRGINPGFGELLIDFSTGKVNGKPPREKWTIDRMPEVSGVI